MPTPMTTANKVTILRIILIPFFAFEVLSYRESNLDWQLWLALSAFGIAALLDGVDGFIARRFHQKSELGAVLDPMADKLLLVTGVVCLSFEYPNLARIPLWFLLTIVSRDVLLSMGMAVIHITCGRCVVIPRWTGKVATVLQMALVLWTLLRWPVGGREWLAMAAALVTVVSGVQYIFDGIGQLSASPRSAATPGQEKK